jgi:predicted acylesterase/phospholipase RssA
MANALLLGGGAPTLTLQAGALAALHDKEVRFDVVSTAGAGMLVGLLFVAPKGTSPGQALESTKEMGSTTIFTDCSR